MPPPALGAGAQYRAGGVLARQHRLRRQGEALHAKLGHHERLTAGRDDHPLTAKAAVLRDEAARVADRRSHLNDALAWSAARWAADQALAAGASVIYAEDLRSMEARGMGKTLNTRLSQAVRGKIVERLRHIAAEHGIAVVTVPPRGTSRNCPPDGRGEGGDIPSLSGYQASEFLIDFALIAIRAMLVTAAMRMGQVRDGAVSVTPVATVASRTLVPMQPAAAARDASR